MELKIAIYLAFTHAFSDYSGVTGEVLTFALGEDHICHTITTIEDILCEVHNEGFFSDLALVNGGFFSDLALVMGSFDVTISPSTPSTQD